MKFPQARYSSDGREGPYFTECTTEQLRALASGLNSHGEPRRLPAKEFEGEARAIAARLLKDRT